MEVSQIYLHESGEDQQVALRLLTLRYEGVKMPLFLKAFRGQMPDGTIRRTLIAKEGGEVIAVAQAFCSSSLPGDPVTLKLFAACEKIDGWIALQAFIQFLASDSSDRPEHRGRPIDVWFEYLTTREQVDIRRYAMGQKLEIRRFVDHLQT